jgi:para-nitrobenzyl esterase
MAPEAAQATAKSVFDEALVTDIAGAQALEVSELLLPRRWGPVKSPSLPRGPFAPDADPAGKSIPFMLGSTKTESTFANSTPTAPIDDAQLRQAFVDAGYDVAPDRIDAVMAAYRAELPGTPDHEVFQVLGSDLENTKEIVDVANLRAEQMAPTYVYYFAQRQGARDGALNVPHTAEIAYVFDNLDLATALVGTPDADDRALADMMSTAWANFARTGNPNGEGVPSWPSWTGEEHATMIFEANSGAEVDPFADRLKALEAATAK